MLSRTTITIHATARLICAVQVQEMQMLCRDNESTAAFCYYIADCVDKVYYS